MMRKALLLAMLTLAIVSCGRRGPAPQEVEPQAFADTTPPFVIYPAFGDATRMNKASAIPATTRCTGLMCRAGRD